VQKRVKYSSYKLFGKLSCVLVLYFLTGCATIPPADFMAPGFMPSQIDTLYVMPFVDHRIEKQKELKLDRIIDNVVVYRLKKKKYAFSIEKDDALIEKVSRDSLEILAPDWISILGPPASNYVLMLVLHDSSSKLTFGSTGNAEVTGYLFDKMNSQVIWRKKHASRVGAGGITGMLVKSKMELSAVHAATDIIMTTLPDRK
jgi:hypothetical protein